MRQRLVMLGAVLFFVSTAWSRPDAPIETKEAERLERAAQVLREILDAPDQSLPQDLIDRAECVVVIPSMVKGGFICGGRFGKGAVSCRTKQGTGAWGPPSLVTLAGGSFGLQIGGAAVDVVMLIMNSSGIEKLLQNQFTVGGDISAAAGPVGRAATAETDAQMKAKILTYSRSQGLFAGLEVKGAALKQDRKGNRNLYGRRIEAREILISGNVAAPPASAAFLEQLNRAAPVRSKAP